MAGLLAGLLGGRREDGYVEVRPPAAPDAAAVPGSGRTPDGARGPLVLGEELRRPRSGREPGTFRFWPAGRNAPEAAPPRGAPVTAVRRPLLAAAPGLLALAALAFLAGQHPAGVLLAPRAAVPAGLALAARS